MADFLWTLEFQFTITVIYLVRGSLASWGWGWPQAQAPSATAAGPSLLRKSLLCICFQEYLDQTQRGGGWSSAFGKCFHFLKSQTSLCFKDLLQLNAGFLFYLLTYSTVFDLHAIFSGTVTLILKWWDLACSLFVPSCCAISVHPGSGAWRGELRKRLML